MLTIWSNAKFNEIRKRLSCGDRTYNPCNVCDVNGTLNGGKSFDRWQKYFSKSDYDNALKNFNKIIKNQQATVAIRNRAIEMIDNINLYYDKDN